MLQAVLPVSLAWLALPATAGAFVYWADLGSGTAIGRANLDGAGVDRTFISGANGPAGVAVDARRIYWTNFAGNTIGRANIDGSGVDQSFITAAHNPGGVAVDGAHVYWSNFNGTIGRANLDGSGANQSFITGASNPQGMAIDSHHVYWANLGSDTIGRATRDGSIVDQSFITGASEPFGVAVDAQHVYWSNQSGAAIGRANLNGTGVDQSFIGGASNPAGVAVDARHVYWSNAQFFGGGSAIGRANLDGTGADQTFIGGANVAEGVAVDALQPSATAISCAPATVTLPKATTCTATVSDASSTGASAPSGEVAFSSTGAGAFDLGGRCALVAVGATRSACQLTYRPATAGSRTITAAYQGEPTHAQSRGEVSLDVKPSNSFRLSKPRLHKRRGTATLVAKLPGAGKLVLKGRRIHRRVKEPTDAGKRKLGVKPTGKKRRKLRRCGTASVKAKVTYTPTGGGPRTKTRLFALRLRRR